MKIFTRENFSINFGFYCVQFEDKLKSIDSSVRKRRKFERGRIENNYGEIQSIRLDLIAIPAQAWLDGKRDTEALISAIKQADKECGSCGRDLDPLYKRALELL